MLQHSTTVRSAHIVFLCFVFIWDQTATCATYSINWLVFITEMKSVYCAVRTGSLNKAVCASYLKGYSDRTKRRPSSTYDLGINLGRGGRQTRALFRKSGSRDVTKDLPNYSPGLTILDRSTKTMTGAKSPQRLFPTHVARSEYYRVVPGHWQRFWQQTRIQNLLTVHGTPTQNAQGTKQTPH